MTRVKYHAIYADTDKAAARRYRIHLRQEANRSINTQDERCAEISEQQREALLHNKVVSETREILH